MASPAAGRPVRRVGAKTKPVTRQPAGRRWLWIGSGVLIFVCCNLLLYPFIPGWMYDLRAYANDDPGPIVSLRVSSGRPVAVEPAVEGRRLIIPKIGVDIEVVEGSDDSALDRGAWRIPQTSTPPQGGNTVISAHRFKYLPPNNRTFYLLDKLTAGDELTVWWDGTKYSYRVSDQHVVEPTAIEILDNTSESRLTLFTCTPLFSTAQRLVVSAVLIPTEAD